MDGQDCFNALLERFEDILKGNARFEALVNELNQKLYKAEADNKMFREDNLRLAKLERFVDEPEINKLYKAWLSAPAKGPDGEDLPF